MEVIAAVLHGGKLAHYEVSIENNGVCTAQLAEYKGHPQNTPPERITLRKEGRHWVSNIADRTLVDDLGYAVEIKVKPLLDARKRDGRHPAG
jgi:hypothetical protein